MNSIENKILSTYKEELQNLEIGYQVNKKTINELIELVCLDLYVHSDYPTDDELLKYLKFYA